MVWLGITVFIVATIYVLYEIRNAPLIDDDCAPLQETKVQKPTDVVRFEVIEPDHEMKPSFDSNLLTKAR